MKQKKRVSIPYRQTINQAKGKTMTYGARVSIPYRQTINWRILILRMENQKVSIPYRQTINYIIPYISYILTYSFNSLQVDYKRCSSYLGCSPKSCFNSLQVDYKLMKWTETFISEQSFNSLQVDYKHTSQLLMWQILLQVSIPYRQTINSRSR